MPISSRPAVKAKPAAKASSLNLTLFASPIRDEDRMFFTEQLALLLDTGTPLHRSLMSLKDQADQENIRDILGQMAAEVEKGNSFSVALANHPKMFPVSYVKLIEASEGGGFMAKVLAELLLMDEKQQQLKTVIRSAMTYPIFLMVFSLSVVVFVMVFVFPKFADIFSSIRDQLPLSTIILMAISDILRGYWQIILAAVVAVVAAVVYVLKTPAGRYFIDKMKLRVPMLRDIFRQIYMVQLMRVLSLSLHNGVSVRDALKACREVVDNQLYRDLISAAEANVQQGRRVSEVFGNSPHIPSLAQQMLMTGEETGNLAKVMGRIADYYDKELRKRLDRLSKLAEPIMLMVMGLVVGIIVSSLILPIFKLSSVSH
jgi:type II secretory pathway component PulF